MSHDLARRFRVHFRPYGNEKVFKVFKKTGSLKIQAAE